MSHVNVHSPSRPVGKSTSAGLRRYFAILSATALVAIAAHISFPLPFTPVPFTLQPLAVLAVALWLGPVDGALSMVAYLIEGALSLPVFAPSGLGGITQLVGPTGGYLLAYPVVAVIAAGGTRRLQKLLGSFAAALIACTLAVAVLFVAGAAWLGWQAHLSWSRLWMLAVLPFLPGEAVKIIAVAGSYRALAPEHHSTEA